MSASSIGGSTGPGSPSSPQGCAGGAAVSNSDGCTGAGAVALIQSGEWSGVPSSVRAVAATAPGRAAMASAAWRWASHSAKGGGGVGVARSEEHTSELQSLMRISYAVFCLKKKTHTLHQTTTLESIHKVI